MSRFKQGQLVNAITLDDRCRYTVGQRSITKIECIMETGQMAGVPWFEVHFDGYPNVKYNGALLQSVEPLPDEDIPF